ncbi:hypothetical protein R3P38DRAFT_2942800 [Favolaschia claudopus]|uniref:Uncharacterized protein n=1 Tax=Favolaschia claudopus TaxID=2862362 RepID=A0AAW0BJL1_9AGAR
MFKIVPAPSALVGVIVLVVVAVVGVADTILTSRTPARAHRFAAATAIVVVAVEKGYLYVRWRGNRKFNTLITAPPPTSLNAMSTSSPVHIPGPVRLVSTTVSCFWRSPKCGRLAGLRCSGFGGFLVRSDLGGLSAQRRGVPVAS